MPYAALARGAGPALAPGVAPAHGSSGNDDGAFGAVLRVGSAAPMLIDLSQFLFAGGFE